MTLLISQNRDAQERVIQGLTQALTEFSPNARKCLRAKLEFLGNYNNSDVVLVSFDNCPHQPEFNLAWFERPEDSSQYLHPQRKGRQPFMVGGLVYHSHSDTWGVHT